MARKRAAAKTSINRTTPTSSSSLERYCRDLEGWPRSWIGWKKPDSMRENLMACFRLFLRRYAGVVCRPNDLDYI